MRYSVAACFIAVSCFGTVGCESTTTAEDPAAVAEDAPVADAQPKPAADAAAVAPQAAEPAPAPAAPAPPPEPPPPPPGPSEICGDVLHAAKAADEAKLRELSTEGSAATIARPGVKENWKNTLANATCASVKLDPSATEVAVPIAFGKKTREMPFVKAGELWKFDAESYVAKYGPAEKKGKKKKDKKGKKKPRAEE